MFREIGEAISINELSAFNSSVVPRMLVVAKSYYDGSGERQEGRLTLAGYSATPGCWADFEKAWPGVLARNDVRPSCRYLHMADLNGRWDQFKDWTDDQQWDLLKTAMNMMGSLALGHHRGQFYGATCTIDLADFERAQGDCANLAALSPHEICVNWVVPETFQLLQPHPDDPKKAYGSIELVFDRNEGFYHHVYRLWKQPYHKQPAKLRHVSSLIKADMERVAPLQAADFLAWLTNRAVAQGDLLHQAMRVFNVPIREKRFDYPALIEAYGAKTPVSDGGA